MTASHAFNCNLLHYKKAKGIILMICIEEFARTNLYIYIYARKNKKREPSNKPLAIQATYIYNTCSSAG